VAFMLAAVEVNSRNVAMRSYLWLVSDIAFNPLRCAAQSKRVGLDLIAPLDVCPTGRSRARQNYVIGYVCMTACSICSGHLQRFILKV
jgi:hypothetical protein